MSNSPQISVVMSVYNGEDSLQQTLDSILTQKDCELEFIIVNDGSTDSTQNILETYAAKDRRIRVLKQNNQGLTCSLIRGCAEARGQYIARQDCGDFSLPGRLKKQADFLDKNSSVVFVSAGVRYLGPHGEFLFEILQSPEEADRGLRNADLRTLRGPAHHGSTMFRRTAYERAGGYRPQFRVAQDLDLWTRLVEHGKHHPLQDILYEAVLTPRSVSSVMRNKQVALTKIISECMKRRKKGGDESSFLKRAERLSSNNSKADQHKTDAAFYYFIACCLPKQHSVDAKKYFKIALEKNPYNLKYIIRYMSSIFRV